MNALFLSVLPLESARIADLGIGFLLILFLAFEHSGRWIVGILSAFFLAMYTPFANISSTYTGAAMAYALFLYAFRTLEVQTNRRYLVWGLLAGILASMKANYTFPIAIMAVIEILVLVLKERSLRALRFGLLAFAGAVMALVPWSIVNLHYFGTAYFPFLGSGYTHTGTASWNDWRLFEIYFFELLPYFAISLAASTTLLIWHRPSGFRERFFIVLLPLLSVAFCTLFCMTPAGGGRYAFSASGIPALFLSVMVFSHPLKARIRALGEPMWKAGLAGLLVLVSTWALIEINRRYFYTDLIVEHFLRSARAFYSDQAVRPSVFWGTDIEAQRERMSRLQSSIPAHEPFVARMDMPFLFDFSRQFIASADVPGCTGPNGGMPYDDPERIADYMRRQGFKYFAYSYRNEALHPKGMCEIRLNDEWAFARSLAFRICSFQENVKPLFAKYKVVYADDYDAVVNLCAVGNGEPVNTPECQR